MIYFLQEQTSPHLIKIGFTKESEIHSRISALKSMNAANLTLIMVLLGSYQDENNLHKYFSDERVKGEWFLPSKKIIKFLSKNRKNNAFPLHKLNETKEIDLKGLEKIEDYFLKKFSINCQSTLKKMYSLEEEVPSGILIKDTL